MGKEQDPEHGEEKPEHDTDDGWDVTHENDFRGGWTGIRKVFGTLGNSGQQAMTFISTVFGGNDDIKLFAQLNVAWRADFPQPTSGPRDQGW